MPALQRELDHFMDGFRKRNPYQTEFHQAVEEVAVSVMPWYLQHDDYRSAQILGAADRTDRIIAFRVSWETDGGDIRANRAWRVQFNHALGPYKGGLRFHPTVTESVLKFLGFEQIFKNSLTGLPMGGAKGGSNFNPKDKSEREVMRFCQSLMTGLHRYIGEDVDIPAGDIGGRFARDQLPLRPVHPAPEPVGGRAHRQGVLIRRERGAHRGNGIRVRVLLRADAQSPWGRARGENRRDQRERECGALSAEKALQKGARVLTLSDSGGFVHIRDGLDGDQLAFVKELKEGRRGRIREFADRYAGVEFHPDSRPWAVGCEIAMPCATQNELDLEDAKSLLGNGVMAVCEGANMPLTADAMHLLAAGDVLHAPGKASNAGGVAVSGLEQAQNSMRISWSRQEVDGRLQTIMSEIHRQCVRHGEGKSRVNYVDGANIAGFKKVADAMLAYGVV